MPDVDARVQPGDDAIGGETVPCPQGVTRRRLVLSAAAVAAGGWLPQRVFDASQETTAAPKPTLYLIATAHNDTQWNWTVQSTINDYIPKTVRLNDALFTKYPHYNFNYEGVVHYQFCKEYRPELYRTIKARVAEGRWKPSGGWINAVDTHVPSAESLFRQALYGQQFFRREFGFVPRDIYLPDCFGFPLSLPTIGRHSGFIAFSTQKFSPTWGCFIPPPFAVGLWEGVDGSTLITSLRPGSYNTRVRSDPSTDPKWQNDFVSVGGSPINLRYFGTGDIGGAPDDESVRWVNDAVANPNGTATVRNTSADQLARDLTPAQIARLPRYKGELLLKLHAVGCYTSQAAMKRWNRQNEQLGDAAERASLIAEHLGGPAYPRAALTECFHRFLWHQFHDDVTGTCIPQAYTFSWNDEVISLSRFARILETGAGAAALSLDTAVPGVPVVVYNPLALRRSDTVEANVTFEDGAVPGAVRVFDGVTGREVASQILATEGNRVRLLFVADMPSVGYKVFSVRPADAPSALRTGLEISVDGLRNSRYQVKIDANGDIAGLFDTQVKAELLTSPAWIELLEDVSHDSPAWEITHRAVTTPPRGYLDHPTVRIAENGPARVSLEITRRIGDSTWIQYVRLTPDARSVEIENHLDWKGQNTLAKAAFHTIATNPKAVFDLDLGVIERGNVADNLWEVPAHQWAGVTDSGGTHGIAIMNDCKYGWDKPADNILRQTLLHSPLAGEGRRYQGMQDVGAHRFTYAIAGHRGDWRDGGIPAQSARLNQPLRAFQAPARKGGAGRALSFLSVSSEQVQIRALKKAEESDEVVVRVQELHGRPVKGATITCIRPIRAVREINAIEEPIGPYPTNGSLVFDLAAFQPRTFAVVLEKAVGTRASSVPAPHALTLPYDGSAVTFDDGLTAADFDGSGRSIPGELFPVAIETDGLTFPLGDPHGKNALTCQGQRIPLSSALGNRLYVLAAAVGGDTPGTFVVELKNGKTVEAKRTVAEWTGHVAQWYSTLDYSAPDGGKQAVRQTAEGTISNLELLKPAFVKRDRIAWVGTHRHTPTGDEAQIQCYLFKYRIDLPPEVVAIVLPNEARIRLFSALVAHNDLDATVAAEPLFAAEFG